MRSELSGRMQAVLLVMSQGASSVSNIALSIFIARESSVGGFATFALVLPIYVVVQRFLRVYFLIPRQIEVHAPGKERHGPPPVNACVSLALMFSCATVAVAPIVSSAAREYLVIMGIALPGLALYDCARNESIVAKRMAQVLAMDFGWLVFQLAASGLAWAMSWSGPAFMACWAAPPLAIGLAVWTTRWRELRFSPIEGVRRAWGSRRLLVDSLTDLTSSVLVVQAVPYAIAAVGTLSAVAALRAGQTLLGPINIVVLGVLPLLHMAVAERVDQPRKVLTLLHSRIFQMCLICVAYALVLVAIPDSIGVEMFGETWKFASLMILPLGFHVIGRTPFILITGAMRSMSMRRSLAVHRLVSSALLLAAAVAAAAWSADIALIPWAMFAAATISSVVLYVAFRMQLSTRVPRGTT